MPRTKQRLAHAAGRHPFGQYQFDCPECWPFAKMAEEREDAEVAAEEEANGGMVVISGPS